MGKTELGFGMMSKAAELGLTFQNNRTTVVAGDHLHGHVWIDIKKEVTGSRFELAFVGNEDVQVQTSDSRFVKSMNPLVNLTVPIPIPERGRSTTNVVEGGSSSFSLEFRRQYGTGGTAGAAQSNDNNNENAHHAAYNKPHVFAPGRHEFPFDVEIPAHLPSSFLAFARGNSGMVEISYHLKVVLENSGTLYNYHASQVITVKAKPRRSEIKPFAGEPVEVDIECCSLFDSGSIVFAARLNNTQFAKNHQKSHHNNSHNTGKSSQVLEEDGGEDAVESVFQETNDNNANPNFQPIFMSVALRNLSTRPIRSIKAELVQINRWRGEDIHLDDENSITTTLFDLEKVAEQESLAPTPLSMIRDDDVFFQTRNGIIQALAQHDRHEGGNNNNNATHKLTENAVLSGKKRDDFHLSTNTAVTSEDTTENTLTPPTTTEAETALPISGLTRTTSKMSVVVAVLDPAMTTQRFMIPRRCSNSYHSRTFDCQHKVRMTIDMGPCFTRPTLDIPVRVCDVMEWKDQQAEEAVEAAEAQANVSARDKRQSLTLEALGRKSLSERNERFVDRFPDHFNHNSSPPNFMFYTEEEKQEEGIAVPTTNTTTQPSAIASAAIGRSVNDDNTNRDDEIRASSGSADSAWSSW